MTTAPHCCKARVIPMVVKRNPMIKTTALRNISAHFFLVITGFGTAFPPAMHPSPFSRILADIPFDDICQFLDIILDGLFIRCFFLEVKMLFDHQFVPVTVTVPLCEDRYYGRPCAHGKDDGAGGCPGFLPEEIHIDT